MRARNETVGPYSRLALGGGISPLGINMQVAVNASRYLNFRGVGNVFNYTVNNISTNGLNISGKLNFATAGASLDFYPFPNHGFRLSPGALFYNQNAVTAAVNCCRRYQLHSQRDRVLRIEHESHHGQRRAGSELAQPCILHDNRLGKHDRPPWWTLGVPV